MRPSWEVIILANWDEIYGQSSRKLGDGDGHQCLARPPRMEQLSSSSSPTLYLIIITLSHSFTPPYWFSVIRGLTDCAVIRLPAALTLMVRLSSQVAAALPKWGEGVHYYHLFNFFLWFIKHKCLFHCKKMKNEALWWSDCQLKPAADQLWREGEETNILILDEKNVIFLA